MSEGISSVGILGDGQLARMLAQAAQGVLHIPALILGSPQSPAGLVAKHVCKGHFKDGESLRKVFAEASVVTLESEFVDCGFLKQNVEASALAAKLFPRLETIELLQNKLFQKKFLQRLDIDTSPFEEAPQDSEEWQDWYGRISTRWREGFVLKTAELGYDGKGVLIDPQDFDSVRTFLAKAAKAGIAVYAEQRVHFSLELAMTSSRKISGARPTLCHFPLVITEQDQGACFLVQGPAEKFDLELEQEAARICQMVAEASQMVGTFAIEFFLVGGKLLVNEIAPRVHNSSHYSLTGFSVSQFEQHWRSLLPGFELAAVEGPPFFAMLNLLAPRLSYASLPSFSPQHISDAVAGADVYWYEKTTFSPGRKMGHVNITADSKEALLQKIEILKRKNIQWHDEINKQL